MAEEVVVEEDGCGAALRTFVVALGPRRPLVAAVAAIAHVVIYPAAGHVNVQAPARNVTLLVAAIESSRGASIRAGLITAIALAVTVVVVEMIEGDLLRPIQTPKLALEVGLVGIVVEEAGAPASGEDCNGIYGMLISLLT